MALIAIGAAPASVVDGDESSSGVRFHDGRRRLLGALVANRPREMGPLRREVPASAQAVAA